LTGAPNAPDFEGTVPNSAANDQARRTPIGALWPLLSNSAKSQEVVVDEIDVSIGCVQNCSIKLHISMAPQKETSTIDGITGFCGGREVFLGFATSAVLHQASFADVLDESSNTGYQRRFSPKHSVEFREYIQRPGNTTIPLTFNLRSGLSELWNLKRMRGGLARLTLNIAKGKPLAQVDCQHRLGYLGDVRVPLAFMTFIGLSVREETQIFNVINGKAKGLNPSLLDYHEIKLAENLEKERPELLIAYLLNSEEHSPWIKKLDLGGNPTVGMKRRASLRLMQEAVKRFLRSTKILREKSAVFASNVLIDFWQAIVLLLDTEWNDPRKHFLTKGIGVYSLTSLAADLYREASSANIEADLHYFVGELSQFAKQIDWSSDGPLKGLGGVSGADQAHELIRKVRMRARLKVMNNG
jgi:DGQHR domain-containing protein